MSDSVGIGAAAAEAGWSFPPHIHTIRNNCFQSHAAWGSMLGVLYSSRPRESQELSQDRDYLQETADFFSLSRDLWDDFLLDMVKGSTQCPCLSQLIGAPLDGPGHIGPKQLGNFLMVLTLLHRDLSPTPNGQLYGLLGKWIRHKTKCGIFFLQNPTGP